MKKFICVSLVIVMMIGIIPLVRTGVSLNVCAQSVVELTDSESGQGGSVSDKIADMIKNIDVGSSAFAQAYIGVVISLIYAPMAIAAAYPALIDIAAPVIVLPSWLLATVMLLPLLMISAIA